MADLIVQVTSQRTGGKTMTLSYNIVCYALVRDEQKPIVRLFARLLVGNIPVREKPLMLDVCFAHFARESTEVEQDTAESSPPNLFTGAISAVVASLLWLCSTTRRQH